MKRSTMAAIVVMLAAYSLTDYVERYGDEQESDRWHYSVTEALATAGPPPVPEIDLGRYAREQMHVAMSWCKELVIPVFPAGILSGGLELVLDLIGIKWRCTL